MVDDGSSHNGQVEIGGAFGAEPIYIGPKLYDFVLWQVGIAINRCLDSVQSLLLFRVETIARTAFLVEFAELGVDADIAVAGVVALHL